MSQSTATTDLSQNTPSVDKPHYQTIRFSDPPGEPLEAPRRSLRSVLQDKGAPLRARAFVNHSSRADGSQRAHRLEQPLNTNTTRVQKRSTKRQKEKVTIWLEQPIAQELKRLADGNQLSISSAGAALLTRAVSENLQETQQALLQPAVQQAVRQELRTH